ncbi:MAG: hypothetical protein ACK4QL_01165 [Pseudanabaenaceae cyanobacterium]
MSELNGLDLRDPELVKQVIVALQEELSRCQEREQALREELEQVKQDNLRLASENLKLQAQSAPVPSPLVQVKPEPQPRSVLPPRPIGSNAHLSKVNNKNIGWFD